MILKQKLSHFGKITKLDIMYKSYFYKSYKIPKNEIHNGYWIINSNKLKNINIKLEIIEILRGYYETCNSI